MRRAPIATVAISVTALLAAACGVPTTGRAADDTGRRGSVTSATAAPAVRASTPTASRPNIVFVLMDDFSMDRLPTGHRSVMESIADEPRRMAELLDSIENFGY